MMKTITKLSSGALLASLLALSPACRGIDGSEPAGTLDLGDVAEQQSAVTVKIKARLPIILDTSRSMLCDVNGNNLDDGQPCDFDGLQDDLDSRSRMYKVKEGIRQAVAAYGEIEWALYGFGGNDPNSTNNSCEVRRRVPSSPPVFQDAPTVINQIYRAINNDTTDGFELRARHFTPLAQAMSFVRTELQGQTDPNADCRPYNVILVTDGEQQLCPVNGDDGQQPAIDAAAALCNAGYPVKVIGFASNAVAANLNALARAGARNPMTGQCGWMGASAFLVDNAANLAAAIAQIVDETILVETCDGEDNDCDGVKDNGFNVGQTCDNGKLGECFCTGSYVCTADGSGTQCVLAPGCKGPGVEVCNGRDDDCDGVIDNGLQCAGCGEEICNGIDDDCDGQIDEGTLPGEGEPCGISGGACKQGQFDCQGGRLVCVGAVNPLPETCNGVDDNCDGQVDGLIRACYTFPTGCVDTNPSPTATDFTCKGRCRSGTQTCTAATAPSYGTCVGQVGPINELCNGVDDDCDGMVDEGFNVGGACTVGTGLCKTTGKFVCSADGSGVVCDAPVISGTGEVCNGIDDDCDGVIDDLPMPPPSPIGEPCGTCGGVYQCNGGLVCTGGAANPEVCNGEDDDCNGVVDDGNLPGVGEPCVPTVNGLPAFMVTGECKAGHKECIAGGLACVGFSGPNPEVCNGKDDDCDGQNDDAAACPSPTDSCYQSACVSPCSEGEFPCPFGYFCKTLGTEGRFCVPNPCTGKVCGTGEVCDPNTGQCNDPCVGIECPGGTSCRLGRCVDCFTLGCPSGQVCLEGADRIGRCTADRCAGVTCGEGQVCKDGTCTSVACVGGCAAGEVCQNNQCVARCSADLCFGANCAGGQVCNPSTGRCITDPCVRTNCGGTSCSVTCEGEATCGLRSGVDVLATGSGGFQCSIGTAHGRSGHAMPVLLLLGLAALIVRRRR